MIGRARGALGWALISLEPLDAKWDPPHAPLKKGGRPARHLRRPLADIRLAVWQPTLSTRTPSLPMASCGDRGLLRGQGPLAGTGASCGDRGLQGKGKQLCTAAVLRENPSPFRSPLPLKPPCNRIDPSIPRSRVMKGTTQICSTAYTKNRLTQTHGSWLRTHVLNGLYKCRRHSDARLLATHTCVERLIQMQASLRRMALGYAHTC